MTAWTLLAGAASAVAVNEVSDLCPWAAKRLVRWSAGIRYADPERAAIRAEELEAVIDSRPGKLLKLVTALCFTAAAIRTRAARAAAGLGTFSGTVSAETALVLTRTLTITVALTAGITVATVLTLPPPQPPRPGPNRTQPPAPAVTPILDKQGASFEVNVAPAALQDPATRSAAAAQLTRQVNHQLAARDLQGRHAAHLLAYSTGPIDGIPGAMAAARSAIHAIRATIPGFSHVPANGWWKGAGKGFEFHVFFWLPVNRAGTLSIRANQEWSTPDALIMFSASAAGMLETRKPQAGVRKHTTARRQAGPCECEIIAAHQPTRHADHTGTHHSRQPRTHQKAFHLLP